MKTRSVLIRIPGHPLGYASLMPDRHLAAMAACLLEAGHWTQVWDYGTLETFERLFPARWRATARRLADEWLDAGELGRTPGTGMKRRWQGLARAVDIQLARLCDQIADDVAGTEGLDFVVFAVHESSEFRGAQRLARLLREKSPSLRLLAAGTWLDAYGSVIAESGDAAALDCLCVGDRESALVEVADRVTRPQAWTLIPNVIPLAAGKSKLTVRRDAHSLDDLAVPAYGPDVYPALYHATKLKLFALEDSRGCGEGCHACPLPRVSEQRVRLRAVRVICEEIMRLRQCHGARAFLFTGAGSPVFHADAIAQALLARRISVVYGRPLQLCHAGPEVAPSLRASGCQVCSFRLDTGSQHLLDDYYARGFGVSRAEAVLRACVAEDMFTVERFVFPCPADDYHSRAETVRIMTRTRPHSVVVDLPTIVPGSDWFDWAEDFGFRVNHERYLRHVMNSHDGVAMVPGAKIPVPYRVGGRTSKRVLRENAELTGHVASLGIATDILPDVALMARVAGSAGQEREFGRRLYRQLLTGDVAALAAEVARFNERACVPPDAVVCRPFAPVRAAMGN